MSINEYDDAMLDGLPNGGNAQPSGALSPQANIDVTPPPVAAPPANDYDDIEKMEREQRKQLLAQSMFAASKGDSGRKARALQLAKEVGLPVGTVERNMDKVSEKSFLFKNDYERLLDENPNIAKFLESPENAELAKDDIESLKKMDMAFKVIPKRSDLNQGQSVFADIPTAVDTGWNNLSAGQAALYTAFGLGDFTDAQVEFTKEARRLDELRPSYSKEFMKMAEKEGGDVNKALAEWKIKESFQMWSQGRTLEALVEFGKGNIKTAAEALDFIGKSLARPKGLTYSIAENAVNAAPSLVAGGVGFGAGFLLGPIGATVGGAAGTFAGSSLAEVGAEINGALEKRGVDVTNADALRQAYKDPNLLAEVRGIALKKGLTTAAIDALFSVFGSRFITKAGKTASVSTKAKAFGKSAAVEMSGESLGEAGGQFVREDFQASRVDWGESLFEGIAAFGQGAISSGVKTGLTTIMSEQTQEDSTSQDVADETVKTAERRQKYDANPVKAAQQLATESQENLKTVETGAAIQEIVSAINETKNIKQVPGKVKELVEAATGGDGQASVFFQVDDYDDYWNKKGESPAQKSAEIFGDNGKTYQDSKNTTGIIEVPLSAIAEHLAEDVDGLLPSMRISPDGQTLSQASESLKEMPKMLNQLKDEVEEMGRQVNPERLEIQSKVKEIQRNLEEQIVAAGRPRREAKHQAQMAASFYRTQAFNANMTPQQFEEFYLNNEIKFTPEGVVMPGTVEPQTEEQEMAAVYDSPYLEQNYDALPDSEGGTVIDPDALRKLYAPYTATEDGPLLYSKKLDSLVGKAASVIYQKKLAKPHNKGYVSLLAGGPASGKSEYRQQFGKTADADVTYDATASNYKYAKERIDQALDSGRTVLMSFIYNDFPTALERNATRFAKEGRLVDPDYMAQAHVQSLDTFLRLSYEYADNDLVSFEAFDARTDDLSHISLAELDELRYDKDGKSLEQATKELEEQANERLSEEVKRVQDAQRAAEERQSQRASLPEAQGRNDRQGRKTLFQRETARPEVSPLGFYSQVEAEIQKMDFKQMPGKDLAGRIKNIQGIKKEELEFLGLIEWLETQENKVSKEDVINYVRSRGLVVEQIVLSDKFADEFSEDIEWSEPKRDRSNEDDDIYNEYEYYRNENEDWIEEQTKEITTQKLEEFTDEDGEVDESGLESAISDELDERAMALAREYVESNDYASARYEVRLDVGPSEFYMSGSDELGWFGHDAGGDLGYSLNEAKIKYLAELKAAGKIEVDESILRRPEDIEWGRAIAKGPTSKTIDKKVKELIKSDAERLKAKARETYPSEYDGKTADEIKEADENNLKYFAQEEISALYEDPNNKKNTLTYNIDHPLIKGNISGNNVKGWSLYIGSEDIDGTTINDSFPLEAKDIEAAKQEAIKLMVGKNVLSAPKEVSADNINEPTGSAKFSFYIKEGETENYREVLLTLPKAEGTFVYSSHFSQENVVAHARLTDRVDVDGKKVLFIEEIQSDWHQQGRDKGYKGQSGLTEEQRENKLSDIKGKIGSIQDKIVDLLDKANKIAEGVAEKARESIPETLTLDDFKFSEEKDFLGGSAKVYYGLKNVQYDSKGIELYINSDEAVKNGVSKYEVRVYGRIRHEYGGALLDDALSSFRKEFYDDIDRAGAAETLKTYNLDEHNEYESLRGEANKLGEEESELKSQRRELSESQKVPDAPLKNTEAWAGLVLKRMIRLAVEQGYDAVSWSPASFQVERWGTDDVTWVKKTDKDGNTYFLVGSVEQRGGQVDGTNIEELARMRGELLERRGEKVTTKEQLKTIIVDTLGRERSEKDLENLTDNIWEQMQIKETGQKAPRKEGMQSFYDKMIPKVAGAILKKLDKESKVTTTKIETGADTSEVWNINLTDTVKEKALEGFPLFQGDPTTPYGQTAIGKDGIEISLFKKANPSTALHELGHAYLEIMTRLYTSGQVSEQSKADFENLMKFLGVESPDQIKVEHHEKFAKSFELYLREGRAPSVGLRKAFANFKTWLVAVYRNIRQLDVELSDEVRDIFDRMLATEEEIREARDYTSLTSVDSQFVNMVYSAAGKEPETKAQVKYLEEIDKWRMEAEEALAKKLMAANAKKREREYREKRKEVRAQIEAEANELIVYKVMANLKDGKLPNGEALPENVPHIKLDAKSIRDNYPPGTANRLRKMTVKKGGTDPAVVASMYGFNSGREMIGALANSPTKESYIKTETDNRMQEMFPDLLDDDDMLMSEAISAVHSEQGAKVKKMQLDLIMENAPATMKEAIRQSTKRPPSNRQIRMEAEATVRKTLQKKVRPIDYLRAERRYAKLAGELLAKGDFAGAYEAKKREMYAYQMYKAAQRFNEQKIKELKFMKKLLKSDEKMAKTRDMNFINAARAIVNRYGAGKAGKSPESYLKQMKAYDPDSYEAMVDMMEGSLIEKASFDEMTVEEFVAIADLVRSLYDMAKTSKEIEIDGKKISIEQARKEIIDGTEQFRKDKGVEEYNRTATDWDKFIVGLYQIKAFLRRLESWIHVMDMGDINGPFRRYIYGPVSKATDLFKVESAKYKKRIVELTEPIKAKIDLTKPIRSDEFKFEFKNKGELLGAILHIGNPSNMKKLLVGYGWGTLDDDGNLDTSRWDAFFKRMIDEGVITKEDMDYIQALWDIMEELKPMAQRVFKKLFGYFFDEVTSQQISTPFGVYRGGYAPAVVDPNAVSDIARKGELEKFVTSHSAYTYPASGGKGFTIKRVDNFNKPLNLDIGLVAKHVDDVLRFSIIKPAVVDAAKVILSDDVKEAVNAVDPRAIDGMIVPALNRADKNTVMSSDPEVPTLITRGARYLKSNSSMQLMFANVKNVVEQLGQFGVAMTRVSPRFLARAMHVYMSNPKKWAGIVDDLSSSMKTRTDSEIFEMDVAAKKLFEEESKIKDARDFFNRNAFFMQAFLQSYMDRIVWLAAYNEYLAKAEGMDNKRASRNAVDTADSVVRETQGTRRPLDISTSETKEWLSFINMFYNFFNMMANTNVSNFTRLYYEDMGMKQKSWRAMYLYWMGFATVAISSELVARAAGGSFDADDDDEYLDDMFDVFFGSQLRLATAMVPIVGQGAQAGFNWYNDKIYDDRISASPAAQAITTLVGVAGTIPLKVFNGDELKKKDVRDSLTALGLVTGLPTGPLSKPITYQMDVNSGKARPSGPVDAARGYMTGRPGNR